MVVGTRPEAIKLAPVAAALSKRGLAPGLILTGQHPALDPAAFGLDALPAVNLRCPGETNPHAHVRAVSKALVPLLKHDRCDLLVVQGDTSSAAAGALAARVAKVPLAHVEAGLRTHDARLPWPEEIFRVAIDRRADLLFAPTATSAANLDAERIQGAVHVTGNSGIDALVAVKAALPATRARDRGQPLLLVGFHRRESWDSGFEAIAAALRAIAAEGIAEIAVVLHPNPHLAARARRLLGRQRNIRLRAPCSHREMIAAMLECTLMLSDSGGVQEEAPALGVPLLVLRDKTERPEGIAAGNIELVGTDPARIVAAVRRLLADPLALATMSRPALPYGDGRAAPRIATVIDQWLAAPERAFE
ncbi:non-hydrolyzing UDP-N-acetylglucosamine 2-epimerase [Sphingomonas sp.]|uniref:non-hydrolyzing UDP-N-acetylglucosamine 2-epimerase n=1 Tax=Sphingomonas sp. TaxID=28214 RepID=UPI00286E2BCB|nr:UDP-N-acetylglucosamine 2-epimerase (non-hydrolyzing) [Sphingomonas sp.]